MNEKRFRANFDVSIYDSETEEYISTSGRGLEEIAKRMNEQQSTIRKLQDLCGKSDYENAKLRIENKKLKEENEQLRKERILLEYQLKVQDRIIEEYEGG